MGMVTLVQQQPDDNHQYQKEQDLAVGTAESHAVDNFHDEAAHLEITVVTPGNYSVEDSFTHCNNVDDEEEETDDEESDSWTTNLPVSSTIVQQHQVVATTNDDIVLPNADPSNFGDVCVKNSTNVHLGNKTFYKGPITIKQFVYTNSTPIQKANEFDASRGSDISDISTSKDDGFINRSIFPQNTKLNKVMQWLWTWRCAALSSVLAVILLAAIILSIVYFTRQPDADAPSLTFPEIPDSSLENITSARFVKRNEWDAQSPTSPLTKMKLPVPYVIISHTVTKFCTTQSECTVYVKGIQTFHMESNNWSDIGYNFLVGGDGLVYVGRDWDYVGAHSYGFNSKSIGISFIGTFNSVVPPKTQLHAAQKIIELGIKARKIAPDYKLLGHRQVSSTDSPGTALYNEITKWPHWSPQP